MSATLVDRLGHDPIRPTVVNDCVNLIDAQVKSKGFMLKSAYAAIKTLKKRFVPEVVDSMLNEWLDKIQPHYAKWEAAPGSTLFSEYVIARSEDVAEDLLQVTDARAEKTSHTTAKKWYLKMRDSAKKNVTEAIPELSRLIERHLLTAPATAPAATAPAPTA